MENLRRISEEICAAYPEVKPQDEFPATLMKAVETTGNKFIIILDEWDAPIRENPAVERNYLEFLRMLFKSSGTTARIMLEDLEFRAEAERGSKDDNTFGG